MKRPLIYDVFSGAGGAGYGYYLAGFEVVGIDNRPQPRYPFRFIQMDAFEFFEAVMRGDYPMPDAWHASPVCKGYSVTSALHKRKYPDQIGETRKHLVKTGKPYVIENVPGSPLLNPFMLCGSMFDGLRVYRHRLFECSFPIWFPPAACNHAYSMPPSKGHYHTLDKQELITCVGHSFSAADGRIAMGIDWMTRDELSQAIPPAYTKFIGNHFLQRIAPELERWSVQGPNSKVFGSS